MRSEGSIVKENGVAAIIGAGTMGAGIAADLANAGWSVHLLDLTAEHAGRGLARLRDARPPLLFVPENLERISVGGTQDLSVLHRADWIVEAVAEKLDIKRAVLARIEAYAPPHALVTSNTSGLSLLGMSSHLSPDLRARFFGTHFLNPPRYLKLLEVVPTGATDPNRLADFIRFAEDALGHRVVTARDTPGFISTRLWIAHLMDSIHTAIEQGVSIETADALTGSQALDLADLAGIASALLGRHVERKIIPDEELKARMSARVTPDRAIDIVLGLYVASRRGGFGTVDPTLERLLGRSPITMQALLKELVVQ